MASATPGRRTLGSAIFVIVMLSMMFLAILPLGPGVLARAGPDLLLVTGLVLTIRRPDLVPVWLVAAVYLLADLLLMRAPGLMAAAMVLASEYIKAREDLTVEVPFAMEWGVAAMMIAAVLIGTSGILALVGAPAPPLGPTLIKALATVLAYPQVVAAARLLFGVGRPGRIDDLVLGGRA